MFTFLLLLILAGGLDSNVEDTQEAQPVINVLEVDGIQVEAVGNIVYHYNDRPRRVVVKFDDIFTNGFEGGDP